MTCVIDYDKIEEWSPWLTTMISPIAPDGLLENLRVVRPELMEHARDRVVDAIGRERLVEHLNGELAPYAVRVFHGTRITDAELRRIQTEGLLPLKLRERRAPLIEIFNKHPEWSPAKEDLLDAQLHRFGPGWEKNDVGRREDQSVHVCLSRAGLFYGCNHYLTHGAEVYQVIAQALFPDGSGQKLIKSHRAAKIVSFTAPFAEAAQAANPYGFRAHELPGLLSKFLTAWAYKTASPRFSVAKERDTAALKFRAPIPADRLEGIEHIDDADLDAKTGA